MGPVSRTLLRQLAREEGEIRRSLSSLRHQRRCQAMPPEGRAEQQISPFGAALLAGLHQHEEVVRQRLADKSRALTAVQASVREGTYGVCGVCGCRIPHRRLAAMPTATLCVSYQEQREADGGVF